jgi:YD repeat-containing protein
MFSRSWLAAVFALALSFAPHATARGQPPTIPSIQRDLANALAGPGTKLLLHVQKHRTNTPPYVTAVEWADLADGRQRMLRYDAAGRLVTETVRSSRATTTGPPTMRTLTFDYGSRTWSTRTASLGCAARDCPLPPDPSSACGCDLDPFTDLPAPQVSLLGHETVDGRSTLHLRIVIDNPLPSTTDLWLDGSTYLPAYEKVDFREPGAGDSDPTVTVTNDFRWLPRTRVTLARFGIVVPTGFRRTSEAA